MRRGVTGAALMVALSSAGGEAWAQSRGVSLDWTRAEGAGDCIGQAELAARVEERLGRAVFSTDRAGTVIAGSVERATSSPRWRGTLRVTRPDRVPESREIVSDAATCRPLSDAMTLVLSLIVAPIASPAEPGSPDPGPGPVSPGLVGPASPASAANLNPGQAANLNPGQAGPNSGRGGGASDQVGAGPDPDLNPGRAAAGRPGVPARAEITLQSQGVAVGEGGPEVNLGRGAGGGGGGREVNLGRGVGGGRGGAWGWGAGAGSVLQVGALPGIAVGPRIAARVEAPLAIPVGLEVQGVWLLGSRIVIPEGRADFQVLLGGVALCPGLVTARPLRVGACAGVDVGGVWVRGSFEPDSYRRREVYGQATAGAWISLRVHRWIAVGASGGIALPLLRHRFAWEMSHRDGTKTTHLLHHTGPFAGQLEVHLAAEIP